MRICAFYTSASRQLLRLSLLTKTGRACYAFRRTEKPKGNLFVMSATNPFAFYYGYWFYFKGLCLRVVSAC
jgi:hypothetical protein